MTPADPTVLDQGYPLCRRVLGAEGWARLAAECEPDAPEELALVAAARREALGLPAYLPELAALEWARRAVSGAGRFSAEVDAFEVNPTLDVQHLSWPDAAALRRGEDDPLPEPQRGEEWAPLGRDPGPGEGRAAAASQADLPAVKLAVEVITPERAAEMGGVAVHVIDEALAAAADKGLLLAPPSRLVRDTRAFPDGPRTPERHTVVHSSRSSGTSRRSATCTAGTAMTAATAQR